MKKLVLSIALTLLAPHVGYTDTCDAKTLTQIDAYTLQGEKNFLTDFIPLNPDTTINVVVEIPAGTTAKWEVAKPSGELKLEVIEGTPRFVKYLGYPGNYGMLPRTLLPLDMGGDGDPLDVIVLGPAVARGSIVTASVIGVLRLLDRGEQDDKIIAVLKGDPLAVATSIQDLDSKFPGVTTILETWFVNYKGLGQLESKGFAGPEEGMKIIKAATENWVRPYP